LDPLSGKSGAPQAAAHDRTGHRANLQPGTRLLPAKDYPADGGQAKINGGDQGSHPGQAGAHTTQLPQAPAEPGTVPAQQAKPPTDALGQARQADPWLIIAEPTSRNGASPTASGPTSCTCRRARHLPGARSASTRTGCPDRNSRIVGVDAIAAISIVAAVGDVTRFDDPDELVADIGLNPKVRQPANSVPGGTVILS
jgi:Transposase IS116/IS110/IS902 family